MKTYVPSGKMRASIMTCLLTTGFLLILTPSFAEGFQAPKSAIVYTGDSIMVQKQFTSKAHKISLYPDASQQVLFFKASGEEGRVYQLFLFNMEGKLAKQVNIRNNQTTLINKIEKGVYLFEVFSDDERIENGQVVVR